MGLSVQIRLPEYLGSQDAVYMVRVMHCTQGGYRPLGRSALVVIVKNDPYSLVASSVDLSLGITILRLG